MIRLQPSRRMWQRTHSTHLHSTCHVIAAPLKRQQLLGPPRPQLPSSRLLQTLNPRQDPEPQRRQVRRAERMVGQLRGVLLPER